MYSLVRTLRNRNKPAPPTDSDSLGQSNPAQDVQDALGDPGLVHAAGGILYKPALAWSNVPGCGVKNLSYLPPFLLSAPEWVCGNAVLVKTPNFMSPVHKPYAVVAPKQILEGVGGLVSGSIALQQLVEVEVNTGMQPE